MGKTDRHVIDREDRDFLEKKFQEIAEYLENKDILGTHWTIKTRSHSFRFVMQSTEIFGARVVTDPRIPKDTIEIVQEKNWLGTIKNIKTEEDE